MKQPVIGTKINNEAIDALIDALEEVADEEAIFYVGYPVAATIESSVKVPALLISPQYGLICFDVRPTAKESELAEIKASQRNIILPLKSKLLQHPELAGDDDLSFKVNAITFAVAADEGEGLISNKIVSAENLDKALKACSPFDPSLLRQINAAIERVANIRPKTKRTIATTPTSKGSVLKKVESEIANLDSWQKAAAIETPDGPQRIRGLAGSGKTIVLALKAAYLHGEHPEWNICVTYHTRSLTQQFASLIKRFYFEDYREEPSANLRIMHSFGSAGDLGVYAEICLAYGMQPRDFGYAKRTYGFNNAFRGICNELLTIVEKNPKPIFDALLIDEAQDLPKEFLRLAFLCTKKHRIVWAYDDLQNLGDYQMLSLKDTFGIDDNGDALVKLENLPKKPRQDIILPKCYRNTPWALVTAHALGSGTYRDPQLVQHPDDPQLWSDIGYSVISGSLELGEPISLQRSTDASPQFFYDLMSAEDCVQFHKFETGRDEFVAVAQMILNDLTVGELYPHDIVVVFPNAIEAEKRAMLLRQYLADQGIDSHIVGVTSSRDSFHYEGKVALTGPYRAKGNEAPMVYLMDAEWCASGAELTKKRNILFTAITRSRGWVRVCGNGSGMEILTNEFSKLKENKFRLNFKIPTADELRQMRTLYRDLTNDDRKKADDFKKAFDKLNASGPDMMAVLQTLPKETIEQMLQALKDVEQ